MAEANYVFAYFTGNGQDGLHLASSRDGLKWEALGGGKSFLTPAVGGKLMRDPCVTQGPDGTFHLVWTDSWGGTTIGYASSPDLIHWSAQKQLAVMKDEPTTRNCWAPEITYDAKRGRFLIYWASTIPGRFPETEFGGKNDNNHRIYSTTTRDFQTFTPTKLFFNPGFNVIDSTLFPHNGKSYMFFKEETNFPRALKNLRLAVADDLEGPYVVQPQPLTPAGTWRDWVEGPTAVKVGDTISLYYDAYKTGRYGVLRTRDLQTWDNASSQLALPRGIRHGTALTVSDQVMKQLLPPVEPIRGMVGVGTWGTQAEFKDIRVTKGNQTLLASDLSKGLDGWKTRRGQWEVKDGVLRQTSDEDNTRALIGDPTWSDYTLTLQARKLSGKEGFLIFFGAPDENTKSWWNIGGWGNTRYGIEAPGVAGTQVTGTVETGRWYSIKVELSGNTVRTYLDGQLIQSATQAPAQRNFGRALIPDMVADPSVAEFDGTFYLYATTDGEGRGLATSGLPVVWKSKDFQNWSFSGSLFPSDFDAKYWAPSVPVRKDGRYYLFPTLNNRITAVVSNSPEGPFRALDGKDINKTSGWKQFPISVGHPIDAEVFRDDDGSYYMMWSQRFIAKMDADFSGFDGAPVPVRTKRGGYSEGPFLFKRGGIYYYLYTLGASEGYQYAYMMSRTGPLGP